MSPTPRAGSTICRIGWAGARGSPGAAAERDEEAIATWVKETWPLVEQRRGIRTRGSASPTKQGNR
ncbi:hypothetical protein [Spongiactinospora sp. TRM90649]|uniref:hypothetical protein n=1 Tax=Spongiactinospora sp. TRM90649 TaxID=3031114 RepID=UPI0023F85A59|nr:hypothetical protein [Spongiactinospora sp. TRM90649]